MQLAVAERGLLVLDVTVEGLAGHAARDEGESALYKALTDIDWIRNHQFEKVSDLLENIERSFFCNSAIIQTIILASIETALNVGFRARERHPRQYLASGMSRR